MVEYTPAPTPNVLSVAAGGGQTATVGTAFATKLAAGHAMSSAIRAGLHRQFSAPTSGASGTFAGGSATATATTGTDGVATAPQFTANDTAGQYQVNASAPGVSTPVTFALTNAAAAPPGTPTAVVLADSYVRADTPASNFGSAPILIGSHQPRDRQLREIRRIGPRRSATAGSAALVGADHRDLDRQGLQGERQQLVRDRAHIQQQACLRRARRHLGSSPPRIPGWSST